MGFGGAAIMTTGKTELKISVYLVSHLCLAMLGISQWHIGIK